MRKQTVQRKNAQSYLLDDVPAVFGNYLRKSNEDKISVLVSEINRIRSEMADSNELWNLEGLSESLRMLASWTDDCIKTIKAKKENEKHLQHPACFSDEDLPEYWGAICPTCFNLSCLDDEFEYVEEYEADN